MFSMKENEDNVENMIIGDEMESQSHYFMAITHVESFGDDDREHIHSIGRTRHRLTAND